MNENQNDQMPVVIEQKAVLPSVMDLTKRAVAFYRANFQNIILISLAPFILSALAAFANRTSGLGGFMSFLAGIASIVSYIVMFELVIKNGVLEQGLKKEFTASFKKFFPFLWVSFLVLFPILGGIVLFVIPGIYIAIMLSFSIYAYLVEGRRGMSALVQSWHYVKGYWWPVFGRFAFFWLLIILVFAVVGIIGSILGINPEMTVGAKVHPAYIMLNDLVNIFVVAPISLVYMFGMYQSLKAIKTTALVENDEKRIKKNIKIFLVIGVVGIVLFIATAVYLSTITNINFDDPRSVPTMIPNINS